jgi:hypothetical protein
MIRIISKYRIEVFILNSISNMSMELANKLTHLIKKNMILKDKVFIILSITGRLIDISFI